jgi:DNA-binding NarL/FixJ family response regulator
VTVLVAAPSRPITVLIADDDSRVREALSDLIGDEPGLAVVGAAADAAGAVEIACRERPDVAVLDVAMPGGGLHAAAELRRLCPGTLVIALSSAADRHTVAAMLEAGAVRFLAKGDPGADVPATIAAVFAERAARGIEPAGEQAP